MKEPGQKTSHTRSRIVSGLLQIFLRNTIIRSGTNRKKRVSSERERRVGMMCAVIQW